MVLKITLTRQEIEDAIKRYIVDAIPTTQYMDFDVASLPYDLDVTVMERIKEEVKP